MIGVDLPEGIHHIHVTVQMEDFFLCPANGELAAVLKVFDVGKVQGSKAGFCPIREEDIPPFSKIGLPHLVAHLQI